MVHARRRIGHGFPLVSHSCASVLQIIYLNFAVKQDVSPLEPKIPQSSSKAVVLYKGSRSAKAAQDLVSAINIATGFIPAVPAVLDDEGSSAPPAAANSAKGTISRFEDTSKGTPLALAGSENGVAEALEDCSGETSSMDLDSDTQGDAAGSFSRSQLETGSSPELFSTSPIQRQIPQLAAAGSGLMDVDSDGLGPQGNNLSLPSTGRSPTNVVTGTKFSAGRHKTLELKTKSIANSSSSSAMDTDTDTPEGDSDTQEQNTSRLRAGRAIKPTVAIATASRPMSLGDRPLRSATKPKPTFPSPAKRSRRSAPKAKSRHLGKKLLKRKREVLEEKALLRPIDFIDLTTDSWLRRSLTGDMEVLKAWHFSI